MTRPQVIATISAVKNACGLAGLVAEEAALGTVLDSFAEMDSRAASILGAKGGAVGGKARTEKKTLANRSNGVKPVKEGSKPRGRPRKGVKE